MSSTKVTCLVLLILSGCGQIALSPSEIVVAHELRPYFDRFEKDIGVNTSMVNGIFKKQKSRILAVCKQFSNGNKVIEVDSESWTSTSDLFREQLMYHELGHCAMDLEHDETMVEDMYYRKIPGSIMYPYVFGDVWFYEEYRQEYKAALRDKAVVVPNHDNP